MEAGEVVCPSCGQAHPPSERFCEACGMPLVYPSAAESATDERHSRARKIKPEYAEGPLVRVAQVDTQPEAEFIAALLLEEGISVPAQRLDSRLRAGHRDAGRDGP